MMTETRAIYEEPEDVQQATLRLKMTLQKFAGQKSDLKAILDKHSFKFEELLTLLETSLAVQKHELERLRNDAKRLTKRLESLAQEQLF